METGVRRGMQKGPWRPRVVGATPAAGDALPSHATLMDACFAIPTPLAIADQTFRINFRNEAFRELIGDALAGDELFGRVREAFNRTGATVARAPFSLLATRSEAGDILRLQPAADGQWLVIAERPSASHDREHRDALTGLPNRLVLKDELLRRFSALGETPDFALLLLDLDRFKTINDTLGHTIGDHLLCRVVERLGSVLEPSDTLVRLGGDEFAILQGSPRQPEAACALAERVVDLIGRSYIIDEHLMNIGVSVGIALPPHDGHNPEELLRSADLALYRAKDEGRDRFRFFEAEMGDRAKARRALELDLRKALALREFEVHYQPQVGLKDHSIIGFEALVRWRHPERGMVSPAEFIPIAEENGLIVQIGEWVLRTACEEASRWPGDLKIGVNLSPRQFAKGKLTATVASALATSGLAPHRLELEITESLLIGDFEAALAILNQLKALGVRIAMDDFGTGYSSLSYLRSFPFDKVKIDQSFVRDMQTNRDSEAIVKAVLGLGDSLGMATTAEGVETAEQLEQLRAHGCIDIQGYFISRPVPANAIPGLLEQPPPGHPSLSSAKKE